MAARTARLHNETKACRKGNGRVRIIDIPQDAFGKYNGRTLVPAKSRELQQSWPNRGCHRYGNQTALMIALDTEWYDCELIDDLDGCTDSAQVPELKITPEGERARKQGLWSWFGGQHRKLAAEMEQERLQALKGSLEKQMQALSGKALAVGDGEESARLKNLHSLVVARLKQNPWWGVMVFDRSRSIAPINSTFTHRRNTAEMVMDCPDSGTERFHYLSENDTKVIYGETDDEVISDTVRLLIDAQKDDAVARTNAITAKMMPLPSPTKGYDEVLQRARQRNKDSKISSVLRSPWTMRMLIQLQQYKPHFNQANFLSQRSLYANMPGIAGGVHIQLF
jgi:hypothetical protein